MSNVRVVVGDLLKSKAQTLVNTVNCVGVMGKGIALAFKSRFPEMYKDYVRRCEAGEVRLGRPYLYKNPKGPWIINFPTKDHWRGLTELSHLEAGLQYLLEHYEQWGIQSIATPPLGCGLGQLEWRVVGPTLYRYLSKMTIPVELYAPHGTPHEELTPEFFQSDLFKDDQPESQFIKPGWIALVEILDRLENQPYHPFIGRTYFQKIAYVATKRGIPTELDFVRGSFGPFAKGLKAMESRLLNNALITETQVGTKAGHMFKVAPGKTYADARKAYAKDLARWEPTIDATVDLFMRMDTKQAEIAATVLFSADEVRAKTGAVPSEREVFEHAMQWKLRRRPPIEAADIALAVRSLAALGWLEVEASDDLPVPEEFAET